MERERRQEFKMIRLYASYPYCSPSPPPRPLLFIDGESVLARLEGPYNVWSSGSGGPNPRRDHGNPTPRQSQPDAAGYACQRSLFSLARDSSGMYHDHIAEHFHESPNPPSRRGCDTTNLSMKMRQPSTGSTYPSYPHNYHACQVVVESRDKAPGTVAAVHVGKLSLVDLAGSER